MNTAIFSGIFFIPRSSHELTYEYTVKWIQKRSCVEDGVFGMALIAKLLTQKAENTSLIDSQNFTSKSRFKALGYVFALHEFTTAD